MENISMKELMNYCIDKFHKHRDNQRNLELAQDTREHTYELCGVEGCCQLRGHCCKHKMDCQFGFNLNTTAVLRQLEWSRRLYAASDWVHLYPVALYIV
jgi:hypothetical protein